MIEILACLHRATWEAAYWGELGKQNMETWPMEVISKLISGVVRGT